eukprot:XP_019928030.1 PREDICTED: sodium/potassium/calcium exchanger 3 [Crassostrea gigas]
MVPVIDNQDSVQTGTMRKGDVRLAVGITVVGITSLILSFASLAEKDQSESLWSPGDAFLEAGPWETKVGARKLNSLVNCTPRAIKQFPRDLFTQKQRADGAVLFHILVSAYMFAAFAYICEDYFVPSLEIMSDAFHIQPDVAGATLMAAGSSAPELATAVIAVFIAEDDIGLGAVVGSAVYNVMFVISVCALGAGMSRPIMWNLASIACLFLWNCILVYLREYGKPTLRFSLRPTARHNLIPYTLYANIPSPGSYCTRPMQIQTNSLSPYEALGLLLLYLGYIVLMYFNSNLEQWIVPKFKHCCKPHHRPNKRDPETVVLYEKLRTSGDLNGKVSKMENGGDKFDGVQISSPDSDYNSDDDSTENEAMYKEIGPPSTEEPHSVFEMPSSAVGRCVFVVSIPIKVLLYLTVPDCRRARWRKWVIVTFILSLVWLSLFSYLMVWMITIIGYTLHIPDTIMALTFVAFGVSLPDVISSLIVVREGLGDMAVSNAVGSNVFDILICLGLPWLLKCGLGGFKVPVQVYSEGLLYSTLTLLLTVVFLLASTHVNGWRLTKRYGIALMIVYVIFNVLASLYELNVFGYVHPNECPRSN